MKLRIKICFLLSAFLSPDPVVAQAVWLSDKTGVLYAVENEFYLHYLANDSIVQITSDGSDKIHLSISPDNDRLVFDKKVEEGDMQIFVMNWDNGETDRLTKNDFRDLVPVWSRDGQNIAFNSTRDGNWEIYIMEIDGTDQRNLSKNPAADIFRDWSWSGDYILFDSSRGENRDIYRMKRDGSQVERLTDWPSQERIATGAPGNRITFTTNKDGNEDIYIMNEDGTDVSVLLATEGNEFYAQWSPDGNFFTFTSDFSGVRERYLAESDGTIIRKLTNNSRNQP